MDAMIRLIESMLWYTAPIFPKREDTKHPFVYLRFAISNPVRGVWKDAFHYRLASQIQTSVVPTAMYEIILQDKNNIMVLVHTTGRNSWQRKIENGRLHMVRIPAQTPK